MNKQVYEKVNFWDGCCTQACGEGKYSEETASKASKKIQCNARTERRQGRVESKTEIKGEQNPLARANKFRAVN